ncbi:golgin subfamily B member 1-like isoform X5 [Argonauta hians]
MDDEAERLKKLKAGKERLAAFQKKKTKNKKKDANSKGVCSGVEACSSVSASVSVSHGEECLSEATPSLSVQTGENVPPTYSAVPPGLGLPSSSSSPSLHTTSDLSQGDVTGISIDNDTSLQEPERQQLFETAQLELREASSKIYKLEESVVGKQKAVERLVSEINAVRAENEMLKQCQYKGPSQQDLNAPDSASKSELGQNRDLNLRNQELEFAVQKRDELLRQLMSRLQMTFQDNPERGLQQACSVETQKLAQHVQLLQLQLQQAGEKLTGQMKQHSVSSQALQEAKCEILNLHQRIQQKDEMMSQMSDKLARITNDYQSLQASTTSLSGQQSAQYVQLTKELTALQEKSDATLMHLDEERMKNLELENRLQHVMQQPDIYDECEFASNGSHLEGTVRGPEMALSPENLAEYFPRNKLEELYRLIEKCIFLYQSCDMASDSISNEGGGDAGSSNKELNQLFMKIIHATHGFSKNIKADSILQFKQDQDFACQVELGENLMSAAGKENEMLSPSTVAVDDNSLANLVLAGNAEILQKCETLQLKIEDLTAENQLLSEEVFRTKSEFDSLLAVKEGLEEQYRLSESKANEMLTQMQVYETDVNSIQKENADLMARLSKLEASLGPVQESKDALTKTIATLKSEKDSLNVSLQEKAQDVLELTERLEASHQEIMNLKNSHHTLEQQLSTSQNENSDFKDQLHQCSIKQEEQKKEEMNLREKLGLALVEIDSLERQVTSVSEQNSETERVTNDVTERLGDKISELQSRIGQMEKNNSEQMKTMADQLSRLQEMKLQINELTTEVEKSRLNNESLTREKEAASQWNISLRGQFSTILALVTSTIGEDSVALDLNSTSNDECLERVEDIVKKISSKVSKYRENLERLELESRSLSECRIQEKEEADKAMKEQANEITQYLEHLELSKQTVSSLETEKQSLSQHLEAVENNCKAKDLEIERLKCEMESLQINDLTKEHFAEMDSLLVERQEEINQLTEELTNLKQSHLKDMTALRNNIEEFQEKIKGKDECLRSLTNQCDNERETVARLTLQSDSHVAEIEKLNDQISSLLESEKLGQISLEESRSKIDRFEKDIEILKSLNENYQQEIENMGQAKTMLESNIEDLKSNYSNLECDNTEGKQSLEKIELEKKQLLSAVDDLSTVVEEKHKLLQEIEEFHQKEKIEFQTIHGELKMKTEALESERNQIQNIHEQTVQSFLENQEKLRKLTEDYLVIQGQFKTQSEEFDLVKKEFADNKEASLKRIADLEKSLVDVESSASSDKAKKDREVQELMAMKESLLVKIEELSRSNGSGNAQLLASKEAMSQVLGKANDELEGFKELWLIEKNELCNKIRSLSVDLEKLQQDKEALLQEKASLQHEKISLKQEAEMLQQEKFSFQHERNSLQHEKNSLLHEMNILHQEKESVRHESEILKQEKKSLQLEKENMQQANELQNSQHLNCDTLQEKESLLPQDNTMLQEMQSLQQQNSSLLQEKEGLQQEKESLLQLNKILEKEKASLLQGNEGQQGYKVGSSQQAEAPNEKEEEEKKVLENEELRWDNDDLQQPQLQPCVHVSVTPTCEANCPVGASIEACNLNTEQLENHTDRANGVVEVPSEKLKDECGGGGAATDDSSNSESSSSRTVNGSDVGYSATEAFASYRDQLEMMTEKHEMELKYMRLNIMTELEDEKYKFEKSLEQKYILKMESVKAENDRTFIENLQKVRCELELKHKQELNELRISVMKECQSMSPQELDSKLYSMMHDLHAENQKLVESRDSLMKQIELLNNQYEQIQEEHFLWNKRSKRPMSSSPRAKRKFDTLPQDIESASRSLVEISRAKGFYDSEEKTCTKLDCQGYRKRYEIALKILTEKGLTSLDNISEKSSFEIDSLDGSTSMGDQPREELSLELQDEYNELMERTITEPMMTTYQRRNSPELQCPSCISLAEERESLNKRLSTQLELFGKERFLLLNRCENLSSDLENMQVARDQLQTELNVVKEVQQGKNRHPSEVELTDIRVKLANSEDKVVLYQNKLSQSEIGQQDLKTKINELFVKLIDQRHYINNLEEEYSRSRVTWNHKGTMTSCGANQSSMDLHITKMNPVAGRRHSEPSAISYDVSNQEHPHCSTPQHLSKSNNNISLSSNFAYIPNMSSPKSLKYDRETSPDSLNKSSLSDYSSPAGDKENWLNYSPDHVSRNNSSPALNQSDRFTDSLSTPPKLTRSTQSSPSLLLLNKEFRESEKILSEFELDRQDFLFVQDKQIELIDEIAELKRSLLESKEDHTKEISKMKEQIDRFHKTKNLGEVEQNSADMSNSADTISLSVDVIDLRQKVSLLRETCSRLTEDNKDLQKKLFNQECLVMKTKTFQTNPKHSMTVEDLETSFGCQLLLLQKHRDELADKLSEERLLENQFTEVVAAKSSVDESLRHEKERVLLLTERIQTVEAELSGKNLEYDRLLQEQLRLEELIRNKDKIEKELRSEKFKLESQVTQSKHDLQIKEKLLQDIEHRVNKCASEITTRDAAITADSSRNNVAVVDNGTEQNSAELQEKFAQELSEVKLVIEKQNIDRLESLRQDMDEHHRRAVEYLRQQLRSDFSMRESRLEEHHAAHVASLHSIHADQLQNLKDEYENQMEELKQEFHNERIKHVRSNINQMLGDSIGSSQNEINDGSAHNKQESILEELHKELTEYQQHRLDQVISLIAKQHQLDLDQLSSHYKDELNLRIKSTQLTAEQHHKSQTELMKASLEEKKQNELAELRDVLARYHNEEIDRREGEWSSLLEKLRQQYNYQLAIGQEPAPKGALGTLEGATLVSELTKRLNDEHKKLIEVIAKDLVSQSNNGAALDDDTVPCSSGVTAALQFSENSSRLTDSDGSGSGDGGSGNREFSGSNWRITNTPGTTTATNNNTNNNSSSSGIGSSGVINSDSVYKYLEEQKEEILLLRSRILKEYEQLLKARTDSMVTESSKEIVNLQDEIDALQQQHEIQISTMRQKTDPKMSSQHSGESPLSQSLDEDQRQSLNKLLSHYETKVNSIEERFNYHMNKLKSQIEHDLSASFGDLSGELDQDFSFGKTPMTKTGHFSPLVSQANLLPEFSASSVEQRDPVDSQIVAEEAIVLNSAENSANTTSSDSRAELRIAKKIDSASDANQLQEQFAHLQKQYAELSMSQSLSSTDNAEIIAAHEAAVKAQQELREQEHKLELDNMQSECEVKLQVELKKQAIELLEKFQAALQRDDHGKKSLSRCESFEKELVKRTMTDGQFDSYDASVNTNNTGAGDNRDTLTVPSLSSFLGLKGNSKNNKPGDGGNIDNIIAEYEARIVSMQSEFEQKMKKLRKELTEQSEAEKQELNKKFQNEINNIQQQLTDYEEKYENLMEDLRSGRVSDVAQLIHEKYDSELELAKTLMQQEFDESLEGEQFRLKEHQEKQMQELLFEKTQEMKELQQKYEANLTSLQETLKRCEGSGRPINDQLDTLRQQLSEKDQQMESERKSLQEKHNQELEALRQKYEDKLQQQQKSLTENHDDQLSAMAMHSDTIKSELDEAHQAELEQMKEQMNSKHTKMVENLNKKHQMDIEELERQFQTKTEELEIRHQLEVECLRKEMEDLDAKEEPCIPTTNTGTQCQLAEEEVIWQESSAVVESSPDKETNKETYEDTNKQLLQHLSNLVQTYLNIEESINRKLSQVLADSKNASSERQSRSNHLGIPQSTSDNDFSVSPKHQKRRYKSAERLDIGRPAIEDKFHRIERARSMDPIHPFTNSRSLFEEINNAETYSPNRRSSFTGEGAMLSHQFGNHLFSGPDLDNDGEELIIDTSKRIQTSIMRLLEMMEETTQQLLESKSVQQELMDTLNMRDSEAQDRVQRLEDMTEQLKREINAREQLALELHKSQGLVEGFTEERKTLGSTLKEHEDREAVLVMENETLRNKVHDLQLSEREVTSLREEVQRQQTILYENAGQEQQGLLDEIRQLNDDKRLLSQLMQQSQESYDKRIRELLGSGEDLEHRYSELLEDKRQQVDDLRLQLETVDRQLKANKQFLNEQSHEREQEREEFQKELNQWRATVQQMERQQNTEIRLKKEVEELSDQLEDRISSQSEMLMKRKQLERDIEDKDLTAQELKQLVDQLEQELDEKVTTEKQQEQRISQLEQQIARLQEVNEELSQEMKLSTTEDKKVICDLEGQLDDQRLIYEKKALTLDEELKKTRRIEEELSSEKAALEQHVCDNLLQIASLKNQLDEYRQQNLSQGMKSASEELQIRDEQLKDATDMVDQLELEVVRKDEELRRLKRQLNVGNEDNDNINNNNNNKNNSNDNSDDGEACAADDNRYRRLKGENEELRNQLMTLQEQMSIDGYSGLTQQLLDEKNKQVEHLKSQIALSTQSSIRSSNNLSPTAMSQGEEREVFQLRKKINGMAAEIKMKTAKLLNLNALVDDLKNRTYSSDDSFAGDMSLIFDRGSPYLPSNSITERTSLQQELSAVITDRDQQISTLQSKLQETEDESSQMRLQLVRKHEEIVTCLQGMLQERDATVEEICGEIDRLHEEIRNMSEHQRKLQEDFDTVQGMLEGKEEEIELLTKELQSLTDTREVVVSDKLDDVVSEIVKQYKAETDNIKKKVKDLENVIEEKLEENYTLAEKLEEMGKFKEEVESLKAELKMKSALLKEKVTAVQGLERWVESSNRVIGQLQRREEQWQQKCSQAELQLREREEHLHQLQEEVMEREDSDENLKQRLGVAEQQVAVQQHNIGSLQATLKEFRNKSSELTDTLASLEEEKEQMAERMNSKDTLISKLEGLLKTAEKKCHDQSVEIKQREESYMTLVKMHQEKDELISIEEGRTLVLRTEVDDLQNELALKEQQLATALSQQEKLKDNENHENTKQGEGDENKDRISQSQSDAKSNQRKLEENVLEIEKLQTQIKDLNSQLVQLQSNVDIEKKKTEQLQNKCEQLQNELQEAWEMKLVNDNHIDDLKKKLFKLESEELRPSSFQSLEDTQAIQSKFTDLWHEIQNRESDVERLEIELVEANEKVRTQETEIQFSNLQTAEDGGQLSEQINILLGKLETSKVDVESKDAVIKQYEKDLQEKDELLKQMQQQLEKSASSFQSSKIEYRTLLGEEQIEATKSEGRIVVLRSEVDDLQKQLVKKESELQTVRDNLIDSQTQLVKRTQEMTRICQHRTFDEEDVTDNGSAYPDPNDQTVSGGTTKPKKGAAGNKNTNTKCQIPLYLVQRLESELEKTRTLLQIRNVQLEEVTPAPRFDPYTTSNDGDDEREEEDEEESGRDSLSEERLFGQIKKMCNELSSMRFMMEQIIQDKKTDNSVELTTISDKKLTRVQSSEALGEFSTLVASHVVWGATSIESPEYHPVALNEPLQKGEATITKSVDIEAKLYGASDTEIQEHLKVLLSRIHMEGIQTLTLSELQFIRHHTTPKPTTRNIDIEALRTAWEKERQTLLSVIQALKELLAQEQTLTNTDWEQSSNMDWRSELLHTLSHIFMRERDVLLSELRSYVLINSDGSDLSTVQRLEQKIIEQEYQQKSSLKQVLCADRQSMVSEMRDLKSRQAIMQLQHHEEQEQLTDKLCELERQKCKHEEQLQRQIKLLEYRLEQSRVIQDDLRTSMDMERKRTLELAGELTKSKANSMDLNEEVTNLQVNLAKAKDSFEQEHSRYLSLMAALEEEKLQTMELTDQLETEKENVRKVQDDLVNITGELGKERDLEYQHLYLALENERDKLLENSAVVCETQAENMTLQQEVEALKLKCESLYTQYEVDMAQLNSQLKEKQSLNDQLNSDLQKERNHCTQLKQSLDKACDIGQNTSERDCATITDLHTMLASERESVGDLQRQLATTREEYQTKISALLAQHQSLKEVLQEQTTDFQKLKVKSDISESTHANHQKQLDYEKERAIRLQAEKHSLDLEVQRVRQREKERYIMAENDKLASNRKAKEMARQLELQKVNMRQNELEVERLREKVQGLETDLQNARLHERQLMHEIEYTKLRSPHNLDTFAAHIRSEAKTATMSPSAASVAASQLDTVEKEKLLSAFKSQLENIRQCLESAGMTFQDFLNKITRYIRSNQPSTQVSSDSFTILNSMTTSVDDMLSDLRELQTSLTLEAQEGPGYPHLSAIINQRTLQHNRELLSSIFKLSEEKLALREQLIECEECIQGYKTKEYMLQSSSSSSDVNSLLESSISMERIRWDQERTSYELALQNCEKRIAQLQRYLRIERSHGVANDSSSNNNNFITTATHSNTEIVDPDLVQTLFRKYFRAESFRKALIYQKNYLLVLLGGFQDSEQTVLALLSRMNARCNNNGTFGASYGNANSNRCHPLARFRSVARVVIAISRMKYLVRKLQQACAMSLTGCLNLSPQHREKIKYSGPPIPYSNHTVTASRSCPFIAQSESTAAVTTTSPQNNNLPASVPYCSLKLRSSAVSPSCQPQSHSAGASFPNQHSYHHHHHHEPQQQQQHTPLRHTSSGNSTSVPAAPASSDIINRFVSASMVATTTPPPPSSSIPATAVAPPPLRTTNPPSFTTTTTTATTTPSYTQSLARFTTPPTKEVNPKRGALRNSPNLYQVTQGHNTDQITQLNFNTASHLPTLDQSPAASAVISSTNGDTPLSTKSYDHRSAPNHHPATYGDDHLPHCFQLVQNNVDQMRHSPQIERQRHRRKYDGFHKNIDL